MDMAENNKSQKKKKLTAHQLRENFTVSKEVKDKLKVYKNKRKQIMGSLKSGEKTIPQISKDTGLELSEVTYYVMSLEKFGEIESGDVDDEDYFFYGITKK